MAGNQWGGTTVGTNYRGNSAAAPPSWTFEQRDPTQYDTANYVLGDLWLNTITDEPWVLVSLAGNTTSKGQLALWIQWGGAGELDSLTGDVGGTVFGDANRNINTLGTAGQVLVSGNPGTNTLTWSLDGSVATEYVENTGSAVPAAGVLNVLGNLGISTTGSGNTIEIDVEGEVALSYPTDSGTAIPAANVLNIFGAGGISTSGAGNTVTINGNGLGPTDAFYAYLGASVPNVTGAATNYTVIFDVEEFDDSGSYNNATGVYTAPTNGLYSFQSTVSGSNFSILMGQIIYSFFVTGTGPSTGSSSWFRANPYVVQDNFGAGLVRANGGATLRLDAGDTVVVQYAVLGGAADTAGVSIGSGSPPTRTWFSGCRIGN